MRALRDRAARLESGMMLVEGEKLVYEALAAGLAIRRALVAQSKAIEFAPLAEQCRAKGAAAYQVPDSLLQSVCDTKTAQGICASCAIPPPADLRRPPPLIVALDDVQDPGNVGTIWRTADAAGFGALLVTSGCADPFSPKVQRAAMGSGFRIPVSTGAALDERLRALKGAGYAVIASARDGLDFREYAPPERLVLIVGNESRGIGAAIRALAGHTVSIPMRGNAESLNAAVAAGILMYHLSRAASREL